MTTNCRKSLYRYALAWCLGCLAALPAIAQDDSPAATQDLAVPEQTAERESTAEEAAEAYPLAELPPLRRLVLYNSGVGQLQHQGQVEGKQRFEIKFSSHDVDDVLKSLVFADEGGGNVRAVEYQPAPEPEDVAANTVGMPMTLAQLIQRFRGEAVTLTIGGTQVTGTIYGVENRTEGEQVRETIVLLNDDGLQSVELARVDRVHFDKEELRRTLGEAMQGVVKSRKANQKTLELLFDGEGQRDVRFAYVVDMPIWRMTYRLSIREGKVYLQGWAHVDNVTGVDWEQVALELRSGKPQSFHVNIFSPLVAERPDFGDAVYEFTEGLILVTQWFGFTPPDREDGGRMGGGGRFGAFGGGGFGGGGGLGGGSPFGGGPPRRSSGIDIESAFRQAAQESRTAQMVRYQLEKPVDLGAGRSAALPVFSNEVPASLISVFDENDGTSSPFRAVQVTNATGLSIVSGPVSIMRDGDFVGDGKFGRLDVDENTEIVYGVDRAVEVRRDDTDDESKLVSIALKDEQIVYTREVLRRKVFGIDNRDTEPRDLVLYMSAPAENENVEPPSDATNDGRLRYQIESDARSSQRFEVSFASREEERRPLSEATARRLAGWERDGVAIEAADKAFLEELLEIDAELTSVIKRESGLQARKAALVVDQSRVRSNVEVLANNPDAAKPFLDKLQSLEEQIQRVTEEISGVAREADELARQKQATIDTFFDR